LVAQFERFVKNTILNEGRPPKKRITRLIKSLSTNKILRGDTGSVRKRSRKSRNKRSLKRKMRSHLDM